MNTAIHNIRQLVGVILIAQFVNFDWVKVKHVNELCESLDHDELVRVARSRILLTQQRVCGLIIVFGDDRLKHIVDLVRKTFTLEKSEKHFFEHVRTHQATLIVDHLVNLLAQVV